MKNVFLTVTLVFGIGIVLFLEGAPHGGEFVAEINTTLSRLSRDLPATSKSASTKRVSAIENSSAVDALLTNAVAHSIRSCNARTATQIGIAEPDCGGWND